MRSFVSIPLSGLFVFLAAFNVCIMLTLRGATTRSRKLWIQVHRICGYAFISLFVIVCYFMLLRIRSADELSPRIALHLSLALILAPLLLVKVIVASLNSAWNVMHVLRATEFLVSEEGAVMARVLTGIHEDKRLRQVHLLARRAKTVYPNRWSSLVSR